MNIREPALWVYRHNSDTNAGVCPPAPCVPGTCVPSGAPGVADPIPTTITGRPATTWRALVRRVCGACRPVCGALFGRPGICPRSGNAAAWRPPVVPGGSRRPSSKRSRKTRRPRFPGACLACLCRLRATWLRLRCLPYGASGMCSSPLRGSLRGARPGKTAWGPRLRRAAP